LVAIIPLPEEGLLGSSKKDLIPIQFLDAVCLLTGTVSGGCQPDKRRGGKVVKPEGRIQSR